MVVMKKSTLSMADVLQEYDQLREGHVTAAAFWDVVVLTTSDAAQQQVYELAINNKLKLKELPTSARYHVIHDPPGAKIGSGGSTMYTLSKLIEVEPQWKTQKILLMHAGGSSQRLPSASVLGKAFTTIPIGNRIYTMFDVKLALLMPFAEKLPPGVFICCPDTFETFTFGNNTDWNFEKRRGFLALAHPSPMEIGTGHGVFVLSDRNSKLDTEVLTCSKVLQKPTKRMMRDEGAVLHPSEIPDSFRMSAATSQEWVFTDSNYFFDHSISHKLLQFFEENKPITGEICAYGDFLQPLGSEADDAYINNCKNIMTMSPGLLTIRRKVYDMLKGNPLNVIALKQSKFYHIGTLKEYIENFCSNDELREELGLSRFCYSAFASPSSTRVPHSFGEGASVLHSLITSTCSFSPCSVVEYCKFTADVTIQANCVISNCEYTGNGSCRPLLIPENTFMQTVPVFSPSGEPMYVTLVFGINDDMKAKVSSLPNVSSISYFDRSLTSVLKQPFTDLTDLFGHGNPYSLWHAKLFPLSANAQSSFLTALSSLHDLIAPSKRGLSANASSSRVMTPGCSNNCITHLSNGSGPHLCKASAEPNTDGRNTPYKSTSNGSTNGSIVDVVSLNGSTNGGHDSTNGKLAAHNTCANHVVAVNGNGKVHPVLYSIADVIKYKDAKSMIDGRNELSVRIKDALLPDISK